MSRVLYLNQAVSHFPLASLLKQLGSWDILLSKILSCIFNVGWLNYWTFTSLLSFAHAFFCLTAVCKGTSQWDKSTYSENSPQIQAAAYNTSQMPIRCMLPVNRWALSSRVAIWATAKPRMALTRIATSSIWEAMRWPCRVPSNRVSSTRILMYLSGRWEEAQAENVSQSGK